MPRSLDLGRLRQFETPPEPVLETKAAYPAPVATAPAPDPRRWPSREPMQDGQISIKAPLATIDRFRMLCRDDRRTYADMLGILMDAYEGRGEGRG